MQWLSLCAGILLCTCSVRADAVCSVPDVQKSLVTSLMLSMSQSVGPDVTPDPSVLLALNLGNNLDLITRDQLTTQLKEDALKRVTQDLPFTSGLVALYTLALRSSCCDPNKVPSPEGNTNLVALLEGKTQEEIASVEQTHSPLTTFYQLALDVLALCVMSSPEACAASDTLAKSILRNPTGPAFSVDTAAVAVLGFTCVLEMDSLPQNSLESVKPALSVMLDRILGAQNGGVIGNIYSTGLAGQALTAAQSCYPNGVWNCPQTLQKVLTQIPQGTFSLPVTAAQVLPLLHGTSYLSVKGIQCPPDNAPLISVEYTIVNDLVGEPFKYSLELSIPEGSTLLQVMEKAAEIQPKEFSFHTEQMSFGKYVTAINNLFGSTNGKTYWQFFSGTSPLEEGVGTYRPHNKEHILAIFSKY